MAGGIQKTPFRHHLQAIGSAFLGLQPTPFQAPYQPRSGTTCSAIGSAFLGLQPAPFQAPYQPRLGTACSAIGSAFLGLQPTPFQAPYQPRSGTTCRAIGSAFLGLQPAPFQALCQPCSGIVCSAIGSAFLGLQPTPFQVPCQPYSGTACRAIGSAIFGAATSAISGAIPTLFQVSFRIGKRRPLGAPFKHCSQRLEVTSEALLADDVGSWRTPVRLFLPLMQAASWLELHPARLDFAKCHDLKEPRVHAWWPLQGSAGAAGERCAFFCKEEEDSRGGACFLLWRDSQLHAEEEERLLQVGGGCFLEEAFSGRLQRSFRERGLNFLGLQAWRYFGKERLLQGREFSSCRGFLAVEEREGEGKKKLLLQRLWEEVSCRREDSVEGGCC
ncbi:hypothetical protein CK203_095133 [Vitis vinifera]|uniref:Uncharacterized protein n=1 Tax=Vitis vinifera TaxID=29760 RepID=A0A438C790_VITVI|nr:hypothetical protein CK203_095133 [Vitis vinifera]